MDVTTDETKVEGEETTPEMEAPATEETPAEEETKEEVPA